MKKLITVFTIATLSSCSKTENQLEQSQPVMIKVEAVHTDNFIVTTPIFRVQ